MSITNISDELVVDALPYIDQGYDDPGVREAALHMVAEETRRFRPTKNYLEHLPLAKSNAFETEMMRHEFERIQQHIPLEPLNMRRYELPVPPPGKMTDVNAWTECVDNSYAQLQHQSTRVMNLELMLEYGCEMWKDYLEYLQQLVASAQEQMQNLKKEVQEINWERKNAQNKVGERLKQLEADWVSLVCKNYEIEQACAHLEQELEDLKSYKK